MKPTEKQKSLIREMSMAGLLYKSNLVLQRAMDKEINDRIELYEKKSGVSILDIQPESKREKERLKHIGPLETSQEYRRLEKENNECLETIARVFESITGTKYPKSNYLLYLDLERKGLLNGVKD